MAVEWVDEEAVVRIDEVPGGKRRIEVTPVDPNAFIAQRIWETHYPLSLIRAVFDVKGPFWLCDEIMRDEDHAYLRFDKSILVYLANQALVGKTILDFGCGGRLNGESGPNVPAQPHYRCRTAAGVR